MSNDLMIPEGNGPMMLPAHLQGINLGVTEALKQGMFTGGNRIGLKGSRFRLVVNGIEEGVIEENYLDVILLSAAPAVSRVYYAGSYKPGENTPPTCYSADGIAPPLDVPQRQSDKCATCPQNVKGSKIDNGNKYKACGYFRRLVLMLAGDIEDKRVFKLDVKSSGLWGEGNANSKNLNDYIKSLESRGVDAGTVVTRMTFDLDSSVPKLLFKPARYITAEEVEAVRSLVGSDEVNALAEVSMGTLDASHEEPTSGDGEPETQQEAPQQPAAQAATPTAQRPQAARPAAQKPQQTAQRPAQTPAVETVPQTARPAQQTAQKPQQTVQRPQQQAAPKPQAQQPAVAEVGTDDELASILEDLE